MAKSETNTRQKKIQLKNQERLQMKLLSPLTGGFFRSYKRRGKEYFENPGRGIDDRELAQYETAIRKAVDRENRPEIEGGNPFDLMDGCFDGSPSIREKVEHGRISVENIGGALYGCTTLILKEELEDWELEELKDFVSIQYSDGWGEGFEQRDIPADGGMVRVYFDFVDSPNFQIESAVIKNPDLENQKDSILESNESRFESNQSRIPETETSYPQKKKSRPKLSLLRQNRHLFSVLPGTLQLLIKSGQKKEADEMYDRVSKVHGYDEALEIIREYVEIEWGGTKEKADPGEQKQKPGQTKEQGR